MARRLAADIVEEFDWRLRQVERPYMTLTWPEFYDLCGRERFKQPFLDNIRNTASGRFQLIVAYGHNAVLVCHDRNFAGVESKE